MVTLVPAVKVGTWSGPGVGIGVGVAGAAETDGEADAASDGLSVGDGEPLAAPHAVKRPISGTTRSLRMGGA